MAMATDLDKCRVCLISNIRMLDINDVHLLKMYEKLTNTELKANDGMPSTICYVCHRQLQKCHRFSEMAQKSNRILQNLVYNFKKDTLSKHTMPTLEIMHNLTTGPTQHTSIDSCSDVTTNPSIDNCSKVEIVFIKEEISEAKDIKDETELLLLDEDHEIDDDLSNAELSRNSIDIEIIPNKVRSSFCCDICDQTFYAKHKMIEHLKRHEKHSHSCNMCVKSFIDKSDLTNHVMLVHTGERPFVCNICSGAFVALSSLSKHMRIHNKQKRYDRCKKSFIQKSDNHSQVDTERKSYKCNQCDKIYSYESHFKVHMRIHTGEKPYSCSYCKKAFCNQNNLKMHMRVHTKEKPYICNKCNKAFAVKCTLMKHILRIHPEEKPYTCKICEKAFTDKNSLLKHKLTHTRLYNSYVIKAGNAKNNLQNRACTEKKSYICNHCEKAFTYKSHFIMHMRIHTGEKPYVCNMCEKAFNQRSKLTTHMRIHTGEKPYVCNICDKAFTHQSNLINHKPIHTGEKPYVCKKCNKAFSVKSRLVNHIMRVHLKEQPDSCNKCD